MKAIKIIYGNITKRINSGAKNYEDLINITQKFFNLKKENHLIYFLQKIQKNIF